MPLHTHTRTHGHTLFAAYPHSYEESQSLLAKLDASKDVKGRMVDQSIYYHRELAIKSIEGRRIDLVTITSLQSQPPTRSKGDGRGTEGGGAPTASLTLPASSSSPTLTPPIKRETGAATTPAREPRLPGMFPERGADRPIDFGEKPVFFLSSRVHPMETPASFIFNGFLTFLLSAHPRARAAREKWVFKLIPMLNPDGVANGFHRSDTRGENLNRCYGNPDKAFHPSIYASRTLTDYFAQKKTLRYYIDLHVSAALS